MLRITTSYQIAAETGAAYILTLEGKLQGAGVYELRRSWRSLRDAGAGVPICVEPADVEFVDAAGEVLLAEMRRAGVEIRPSLWSACGEVRPPLACVNSSVGIEYED